jgi:hypothetical protein
MTYAEKLKDPRWQRRRLEILSKNNFTCERCDSTTNSLHIHHCYYERGLQPWEYPDSALKCLCENCHGSRQEMELAIQKALAGMSFEDLDSVWCGVFHAISVFGAKSVSDHCNKIGGA